MGELILCILWCINQTGYNPKPLQSYPIPYYNTPPEVSSWQSFSRHNTGMSLNELMQRKRRQLQQAIISSKTFKSFTQLTKEGKRRLSQQVIISSIVWSGWTFLIDQLSVCRVIYLHCINVRSHFLILEWKCCIIKSVFKFDEGICSCSISKKVLCGLRGWVVKRKVVKHCSSVSANEKTPRYQ